MKPFSTSCDSQNPTNYLQSANYQQACEKLGICGSQVSFPTNKFELMEMETTVRPVPDGSEKDEKIVKYCQTGIGVNRRVLAVAAVL